MKSFFALGLLVFSSAGIEAQVRAPAVQPLPRSAPPILVPSAGALGGNFASVGISRPLGGIAPPSFPGTGNARRHRTDSSGARYVGPVYYVPNASDLAYDPAAAYAPVSTQPGAAAAPVQPIVINQYFSSRGSRTQSDENGSTTTSYEQPAQNPGDPLVTPQNYYLIAYRDHTVYSALAYWVEGSTLHYVTLQNTHNQASLNLIDLDQTAKLNSDRSVPFSIPGK